MPSTVNILTGPKHDHKGSGIVIDEKGYVLTHAHHGHPPDTPATVVFPDGRRVAGKFLGVHEQFDLSLVRLEGRGPWPAVPLGDPAALKPGDPCLMLGYPKMHYREGQPPFLRLGRFAGPWGHYLLTSGNLNGGDSGGPLVGLDGKLLGNNNLVAQVAGPGIPGRGTGHTSVDCFREIRPQLLAGRYVGPDRPPARRSDHPLVGPFEGVSGTERLATSVHKSVLTVLDGNHRVALGLVVDAAGWAVTKASELPVGKVVCELADGRKLEATIAGRDRDHDLALLRLSDGDLPAVVWSDRTPEVGQVLAAVGPEPRPSALGIMASGVREVPDLTGVLAFEVVAGKPGEAGVRVSALQPSRPRTAAVLRDGDVITRVEDTLTPDPVTFARAVGELLRGPTGRPGEWVGLTVVRDGREQAMAAPVEPPYTRPWSPRHAGFPAAFVYDGVVLATECGGPLVGTDSKVAAVVAARIGPASRTLLTSSDSRTYAIPAERVRKVVAELRKKVAE